jgi:glycerol-3-phosphate acyltransferase PlsX
MEALAESYGRFSLFLVGQKENIEDELRRLGSPQGRYEIVHAPEVIEMDDSPNSALRSKRHSSINVGLTLQHQGKAHAFVSAGNTGAVLSASTIILGRIKGIGRPTIGAMVPTVKDPCLLVDAGANVDCRPQHLFEFGLMGSIYVTTMLGKRNPRIALLSIGEEETKGNEASLEAFALFRKQHRLNFVGNVEGRDVLRGEVDVVVCDGFVGNILLKFGESIPSFLKAKFTGYAAQRASHKLVALVARRGLRNVMREMDYQEKGGVPLLGVNGVSIIGHGGSTPKAIKNMIFRAEETVNKRVSHRILEAMRAHHG